MYSKLINIVTMIVVIIFTILSSTTNAQVTTQVDAVSNCVEGYAKAKMIQLSPGTYTASIISNTSSYGPAKFSGVYIIGNGLYEKIMYCVREDQPVTFIVPSSWNWQQGIACFVIDGEGYLGDNSGIITLQFEKISEICDWRHERYDLIGSSFNPISSTVSTSGPFIEKWSNNSLSNFHYLLSANVNNDDQLEIVIVKDNILKIFDYNGTIIKEIILPNPNCAHPILEDVTGDNINEIAIGTKASSAIISTYFYSGDGSLLKTLSKSGGSDSFMWPIHVLTDGRIIINESANYSAWPRGFAIFDYQTGAELWYYSVGPWHITTSIKDMDNDGKLEFTNFAGTVNNGGSGDGFNHNGTPTNDSQFYTIVVDEDGNEEFTKNYSSDGQPSGRVYNYFVDLDKSGVTRILAAEGHPTYHGTSQLHLLSATDGSFVKTFNGAENSDWTLAFGDINNDYKDEVVASNGKTKLYLLDYNLNELNSKSINGDICLLNDIDGDGQVEIVLKDGNILRVVDDNLNQEWQFTAGGTIITVIVSDTDLNGKNELIFSADKLYVLEGSGGTDIQTNKKTSLSFYLSQNYPNPFNPETNITYKVPKSGFIRLKIFNQTGQIVRTLINEYKSIGEYSVIWDGKDNQGNLLASGIYFYQLNIGDFNSVKKMIKLK